MAKFYLQYMYLTDIIYLDVGRLIRVMISQYQRRSQKTVKKPMTKVRSENGEKANDKDEVRRYHVNAEGVYHGFQG